MNLNQFLCPSCLDPSSNSVYPLTELSTPVALLYTPLLPTLTMPPLQASAHPDLAAPYSPYLSPVHRLDLYRFLRDLNFDHKLLIHSFSQV